MRRSQRFLAALGVLAILALNSAPASAQNYRANCAACQPIVNQLEQLERELAEANRNYYRESGLRSNLESQNIRDRLDHNRQLLPISH